MTHEERTNDPECALTRVGVERNWRRELELKEARAIAETRDTTFWHTAMRELAFTRADMDDTHNVRMVAARAQQLKEEAS